MKQKHKKLSISSISKLDRKRGFRWRISNLEMQVEVLTEIVREIRNVSNKEL
jgi:hypothetical protein